MMPRIVLSAFVVLGSAAAIAAGATGAFFSDTEASTGNLFTAGAIDLKVDNESYYNGNKCAIDAQDVDQDQNITEYVWQGVAAFPIPGTSCETSFPPSDLDNGLLFFKFTDLKPDDEGEDTISLHAQNDAYACMEISLTSNDDVSSNEPELESGDTANTDDAWDGELAQNIQFFWWADDGDNVYEDNENPLTESNGVETLYNLATTTSWKVALADSQNNVWSPNNTPAPIPANQTAYIGKAWCFGTMTLNPLPAGTGVNPSVATGITCNGAALGNQTQTDATTLNVAFSAVQSRNNGRFLCDETTRLATITVTKVVTNNNGGNNIVSDFQLFVDDSITTTPVSSGVSVQVPAGTYNVSETGVSGYVGTYGGDCDAFGSVTIGVGETKSCTITNDDLPANITLIKNVTGTPPLANPSTFGLTIDGNPVPNNTSVAVNSNIAHAISEVGRAGYSFVSITGSAKCPAVLGGTATLDEGEAITCTITNNKN